MQNIIEYNKTESKHTINRTEQLKSYLKRLGEGESLENVRADFVKNFSNVAASEILKAEQELLAEGTPLTEVQKLCDIHSALFHGTTQEEKIAQAQRAVAASMRKERALELTRLPGHPLYTLAAENVVLNDIINNIKIKLDQNQNFDQDLLRMKEITIHYAKKGDLLYPHLSVQYKVVGPSDVMWTVDDEIRDELTSLTKNTNHNEEWTSRVQNVLKRAEEMIYKENNILFPVCTEHFTKEDWMQIYQDAKDYSVCLSVEPITWEEAEEFKRTIPTEVLNQGEIVMPGGHMTIQQLTALLNTIPLEITFIDDNNINCYFNEGPKVFKRPSMAIGREVFSCHPPKIEPMVRAIIEDFRDNKRDSVPVWMDKGGKTMLVTYMAVRDRDHKYLGTMEIIQDMEFAKQRFSGK